MSVNLGLAQVSNDFLVAALLIYSLAVLAFAGDYAFGQAAPGDRPRAAAVAAGERAAQLATVGAAPGTAAGCGRRGGGGIGRGGRAEAVRRRGLAGRRRCR